MPSMSLTGMLSSSMSRTSCPSSHSAGVHWRLPLKRTPVPPRPDTMRMPGELRRTSVERCALRWAISFRVKNIPPMPRGATPIKVLDAEAQLHVRRDLHSANRGRLGEQHDVVRIGDIADDGLHRRRPYSPAGGSRSRARRACDLRDGEATLSVGAAERMDRDDGDVGVRDGNARGVGHASSHNAVLRAGGFAGGYREKRGGE